MKPDLIAERPNVYLEMTATLREQIATGHFIQGDRIPTENELAKTFGISIRSVRNSVDTLVGEGLLARRQGSGTYVTKGRPRSIARIRLNAVAVVIPLLLRGYHPFFSEMVRGVREGIKELGFAAWEPDFGQPIFADRDIAPLSFSAESVFASMAAQPHHFSGVICGGGYVARLLQTGVSCPMVAVDPTENVPHVGYHFESELDFAVMRQSARGARRIWIYGAPLGWTPACPGGAEILLTPGLQGSTVRLSAHIHRAYEEATRFFHEHADIDGVIVSSDFESQGVLDAAVQAGLRVPERVKMTCLVNRMSQLVYPFPITLQVADGYAKGRRAVELLEQHLQSPVTAPHALLLRCEEQQAV